MTSPTPPILLADPYASPRWETQAYEIVCPLCDYNLRGLADPRCPECGYEFHWRDLLDPARQAHAYLFELQPEKNIRSFFSTAMHGWKPGKFWSTLRPDHRFSIRRLWIYGVITTVFALLPFVCEHVLRIVREWIINRSTHPGIAYYDLPQWVTVPDLDVGIAIAVAIWPGLLFLTLMIFQASMHKAQVKKQHVLRCIVYCGDVAVLAGIAAFVICAIRAALMLGDPNSAGRPFYQYTYVLWPLAGIFVSNRMVVAYRNYLRFDRAFATILSAQVIVHLATLTVMLLLFMEEIVVFFFA